MGTPAVALEPSGLVLARYRPLRPLGSGGSGSVWLARDEQTGLDVALKIIAREGKAAARAEREAAAAARLRHPACLRAYALERDARHVYIAYEFVPGRTFREAMRAGELRDAAAIEACAQVCDALAHAHGAGILHRDVKPSNVLLADPAAAGTRSSARGAGDATASGRVSARLLDFGLARMAEAETLTEQGDVPGTLAYISPERLAGERSTAAADVWAVGVMLWEALAGRHPFWQGSMLDTARAIERGAEPLAALRPDLPKRLQQAVDRALSPSPARRPSAAELAEALRGAAAARRRKRARRVDVSLPREPGRLAAAALAGVFAGGTAALIPFYPHGWIAPLALLCAVAALARERAGLALALAVPVLPLGNVSLGLALLWTGLAAAWLVLTAGESRSGLLFAVGPLLGPVGALGLVPLLAARAVRSPARRFAHGIAAVLVAAAAAGIRGANLPFAGARVHVALAERDSALGVAEALVRVLTAHAGIGLAALVLGVAAAALPKLRSLGPWGIAGAGALLLLPVLVAPAAAAAPIVATAWLTCAALVASRHN